MYPFGREAGLTSPGQEGVDVMRHELPDKIHFIGMGGAGMSGLATVLLALGHQVSGSDLKPSASTRRLEKLGAVCYTDHSADYLGKAGLVVVSTAIPPTNPELIAARRREIPVMHRGQLLAALMRDRKGIAVAGAHGKTTTTSMVALVLEKNDLDPTILIGGELTDIGGNAKLGRGEYLVAEADESDGSFLKLDPMVTVVTNIEDDHLDHYGTVENIIAAFREFLGKLPASGLAVLCGDDPVVQSIRQVCAGEVVTYGLMSTDADYTARNLNFDRFGSSADIYCRGELLGQLKLPVPGRHNILNAMAAVAVGRWLNLPFKNIAGALACFQGAGRRFELLGEERGVRVVDDYAHHPSEIMATLEAARQVAGGRVIAVFQPHRYTRTALLKDRFGRAFSQAEVIIINDIYSAGEKPIDGITARVLVKAVEDYENRPVLYLPTREDIVDYLASNAVPGDLVLVMGAGDIRQAGAELVKKLKGS
jgi:UDP-N-acetylmuramate--alanine ligase